MNGVVEPVLKYIVRTVYPSRHIQLIYAGGYKRPWKTGGKDGTSVAGLKRYMGEKVRDRLAVVRAPDRLGKNGCHVHLEIEKKIIGTFVIRQTRFFKNRIEARVARQTS